MKFETFCETISKVRVLFFKKKLNIKNQKRKWNWNMELIEIWNTESKNLFENEKKLNKNEIETITLTFQSKYASENVDFIIRSSMFNFPSCFNAENVP